MDDDGESSWRNLDRKFGSVKLGRWCQFICKAHDSRNLLSVIMIEQKQFRALPRTEVCEAKVGRCMGRDELGRLGVARRGKRLAPELKWTKKVTADTEGAGTTIATDCGGKNSRG